MRAAHRLRSAAPPRRRPVLSRTLPRPKARRRPSPPRSPATPARQDRVAPDNAGSPQISTPRDLRHARSRLADRRNQSSLLSVRPNPAPLRARNNCHLTHHTIANAGASTAACTSATSADHPFPARRSTPAGYAGDAYERPDAKKAHNPSQPPTAAVRISGKHPFQSVLGSLP